MNFIFKVALVYFILIYKLENVLLRFSRLRYFPLLLRMFSFVFFLFLISLLTFFNTRFGMGSYCLSIRTSFDWFLFYFHSIILCCESFGFFRDPDNVRLFSRCYCSRKILKKTLLTINTNLDFHIYTL
jgi:hypothetical protein